MRGMNRRVVALDIVTARDEGRLDLSRLTDAELAELEQVCLRVETLVAGGLWREMQSPCCLLSICGSSRPSG